ncbi:MAG TPA: Mrp/NBP35 family ATP-binding protein [Methanotrichaceae archaeon]|nr:Mrp/NBP35 family ATP-binding protein [Methanotrichaceae archaeon]
MEECDSNCESCATKETCTDPRKEMNEQLAAVSLRMARVKHKIMVASGKGGVGKSTVTVNLARALQSRGYRVGVLDADITGPSVAKLLGVESARLTGGPEGIEPVDSKGLKVISMAFALSGTDSAVVWRGPMKMAAIKQFMSDVNWGDLDFLIIDLPPGTSDEPLSVVQLLPDLSGAVIVTTPQEVALLDSRKAVNMVKSMKVPLLGIVENMSGLRCPHCGEILEIFKTGGGKRAAEELGVPFLGAIPLDPEVAPLGDSGVAFVEKETAAKESFVKVVNGILDELEKTQKAG